MVIELAMDVFALNQDNSDAQVLLTVAERGIANADSPRLVMSHNVIRAISDRKNPGSR